MAEPPPAITFKIPARIPTMKSRGIKDICSIRFGSAAQGGFFSGYRKKKLPFRGKGTKDGLACQ
jgi:hypothetical protein